MQSWSMQDGFTDKEEIYVSNTDYYGNAGYPGSGL